MLAQLVKPLNNSEHEGSIPSIPTVKGTKPSATA